MPDLYKIIGFRNPVIWKSCMYFDNMFNIFSTYNLS